MDTLEKLFREATSFHKTACLLAGKFTGLTDLDPEKHQRFPMLFRDGDGSLVRSVARNENMETNSVQDSDLFFTPLVVNAAFSLELHLKHLSLLIEKKEVRGHDLHRIFLGLSEWTRENLEGLFQHISSTQPMIQREFEAINAELSIKRTWSLEMVLKDSAKAFETWRYSHEKNVQLSSFAGYGEAICAMRIIATQFKGKPEERAT